MKVVILCGGMGTRLREETEFKPKAMIEIGGRPILWHIMKIYSAYGFNDFILCLGYKQHVIREYFLNYEYMSNDFTINLRSERKVLHHKRHNENWNVTLVDTGNESKKGTRIKRIEPYVEGEHFMVTYGDGVANINIKGLLDFHLKEGSVATFTGVHPISRFATAEMDGGGRIVGWEEKKKLEGYINGGFFVLGRKVFEYLGDDCELEEEPMKRLAQEGRLGMYRHEGFWHCMDTYRDYLLLDNLWCSEKAPWKIWGD